MKRLTLAFLLSLVLLAVTAATATAGKNSGGALVVHTDDAHAWRTGHCYFFDENVPQECELLNTQTDNPPDFISHIWFIAAFDAICNLGVTSIYFGNAHNLPPYYHNRWGWCGPIGSVEHPDAGWPDDPLHAGNWIEFGSPMTGDTFFPLYWAEVWGFEGVYYGTGIHPALGYAAFVDDSEPPQTDAVERFGEVRWYEPGANSCPSDPIEDLIACCIQDGVCLLGTEALCNDIGGASQGPGSVCDPNPCPQPPRWVCCLDDGECRLKTQAECDAIGGTFHDDETECDPNPCPQPDLRVCCLQSGECRLLEEEPICADLGGIWLGDLTECTPNPCYGACCFYSGDCQMQPLYWCGPMGGDFMGAGSDCDPNPCVNSNVPEMMIHETTWGAVKARYR